MFNSWTLMLKYSQTRIILNEHELNKMQGGLFQ